VTGYVCKELKCRPGSTDERSGKWNILLRDRTWENWRRSTDFVHRPPRRCNSLCALLWLSTLLTRPAHTYNCTQTIAKAKDLNVFILKSGPLNYWHWGQ